MAENEDTEGGKPTRRAFMAGGAAALGLGAAASQARPGPASAAQQRLIDKALASASGSAGASLSDVKHVVILMQENRSFDHYFGTLSGVRGFSDPGVLKQTVGGVTYPVFDQFGFQPGTGVDASGYTQPFRLLSNPPTENGQDTNDITHSWGAQHQSWSNGAMDQFMAAHLAADGDQNGPVTMGYFTRADLGFYYALADAFTICDHYFCSVLGPTDPNRLMGMSASIDPGGTVPSVSWIIPPLAECEHPAAPPEYGEYLVQQVLNTLVSNPDVWAQTVLLVIYDENGGFFDHVPPPAAPAGTAGEYLTTLPSAADGIAGPVGLGFRTPALVVSPFSRGGYVCSQAFDHTSTLRFIETRFGVEVPNLTAWRRGVTGDLTGALNLTAAPNTGVPSLPVTSLGDTSVAEQAVLNALAGTLDVGIPYPLPDSNTMPSQETTPARPPVP